MVLSKSFGYALRGILYVSLMQEEKRKVSLDEIAVQLAVPRHYLAKIMKAVVKAGVLSATRGQQGGFFINNNTLNTSLTTIIRLTDGEEFFNACMLSLRKCNSSSPCPLHSKFEAGRRELFEVCRNTTIEMVIKNNKSEFIRSISVE